MSRHFSIFCLFLFIQFCYGLSKSLPTSHPIYKTPSDLVHRIHKSSLHNNNNLNVHSLKQYNQVYNNHQSESLSSTSLKCSPSSIGGDPTGLVDSTVSLQTCITWCVNQSALSPNGLFPGSRSFGNGKAIRDAGGCLVDLAGGEYLISKPLNIPEYIANMQIGYGSLIAHPDLFPSKSFLLMVGGNGDGCQVPQGSCNIDINFPFLFLDGSNVAYGLIQINSVMGTTIGPGGYFLNFTNFGVQINGGHEVMMDRVWLGETNFDFDWEAEKKVPSAIAIQINGNDHYIVNTIVFSSMIGVEVNGAANVLTGVHVWFPVNRALIFKDQGTKAFHVTGGSNRFTGCYIDGGIAVFDNTQGQVWTNGFECCANVDNVPHGIVLRGATIGPGLIIMNNLFGGGTIVYENTTATKPTITNVVVYQNSFQGNGVGSRITASLTQSQSNTWTFDLCDRLLFPLNIETVKININANEFATGFVVNKNKEDDLDALATSSCKLEIQTSGVISGTVTIDVDSSTYDQDFI